jgi:hypothetical protein
MHPIDNGLGTANARKGIFPTEQIDLHIKGTPQGAINLINDFMGTLPLWS